MYQRKGGFTDTNALKAKCTYRENRSSAQWPLAIISFMIWRPVACNGPMPLPGRNRSAGDGKRSG
jgi:hypothetical protein